VAPAPLAPRVMATPPSPRAVIHLISLVCEDGMTPRAKSTALEQRRPQSWGPSSLNHAAHAVQFLWRACSSGGRLGSEARARVYLRHCATIPPLLGGNGGLENRGSSRSASAVSSPYTQSRMPEQRWCRGREGGTLLVQYPRNGDRAVLYHWKKRQIASGVIAARGIAAGCSAGGPRRQTDRRRGSECQWVKSPEGGSLEPTSPEPKLPPKIAAD
jgi:hypothetical protein